MKEMRRSYRRTVRKREFFWSEQSHAKAPRMSMTATLEEPQGEARGQLASVAGSIKKEQRKTSNNFLPVLGHWNYISNLFS